MLAHEQTRCPAKDQVSLCSAQDEWAELEFQHETNWKEWQPPDVWPTLITKDKERSGTVAGEKLETCDQETTWHPRLALRTRKNTCGEIGEAQIMSVVYLWSAMVLIPKTPALRRLRQEHHELQLVWAPQWVLGQAEPHCRMLPHTHPSKTAINPMKIV